MSLPIVGIALLMLCMFGCSDDPTPMPTSEPTSTHSPAPTATPTNTPVPTTTPTAMPTPTPTPVPLPGRIAFVSDRDGNEEIYVMNADATGVTRLTNHPADDDSPAWSPDGTRIAFDSARDDVDGEIYVMNADGTGVKRLTNSPYFDAQPAWSPDGERIAFISGRDGPSDIYVMNADGTGVIRLTTHFESNDWNPTWSPDGSRIAFESNRDVDDHEIYVIGVDGTGLTRLTYGHGGRPAWSPDGSSIAFVSYRDGGDHETYVMNADGTEVTRLTNAPREDTSPAWSPDGQWIAYTCVPDFPGSYEICAMRADGSDVRRITNNGHLDHYPSWGPPAPGPGETPTVSPTTAPTATPTPAVSVQSTVASYVRGCETALEAAQSDYPALDEEADDFTWGQLAELLDVLIDGFGRLSPPQELQEYHDADQQIAEVILEHARTRPSDGSFLGEFLLTTLEIAALTFEVAFDGSKTPEEQERLVEEITTERFGDLFGPAFLTAAEVLGEAKEALSEETLALFDESNCELVHEIILEGESESDASVDSNIADDHGDGIQDATAVAVGDATAGALNSFADADFFRFTATAGVLYQIDVELGTLDDSLVELQDSDGWFVEYNDDFDESLGSRIVWEAPESGDYYVRVSSGSGSDNYRGTYALTISHSDIADDHGNNIENATAIAVGEATSGELEYDGDSDYFFFAAQSGQTYQISVALTTLDGFELGLIDTDDFWLDTTMTTGESPASPLVWEAGESGNYFIRVGAPYGKGTGTYTLTVSEFNTASDHGNDIESASPDRAALVALYNATGGPNWVFNTNWLSDRPIDEWYGVTTNSSGRVTTLQPYATEADGALTNNGLRGSLPRELGTLAYLEVLALPIGQLSGEIPRELGTLANLEWLALSLNQLSGQIPRELGNLANLELLYLDYNRLSGEIPPELGSLANLEEMWLQGNQLSGEIPPQLGNLANLQKAFISGNSLTGCLPSSWRIVSDNDFAESGLSFCGATATRPDRAALVGLPRLNCELFGGRPELEKGLSSMNSPLRISARQVGGSIISP